VIPTFLAYCQLALVHDWFTIWIVIDDYLRGFVWSLLRVSVETMMIRWQFRGRGGVGIRLEESRDLGRGLGMVVLEYLRLRCRARMVRDLSSVGLSALTVTARYQLGVVVLEISVWIVRIDVELSCVSVVWYALTELNLSEWARCE